MSCCCPARPIGFITASSAALTGASSSFSDVEALSRDAAVHLAAVLQAAGPGHETLGFQAIEEPGDAGSLLDHPLPDFEHRQRIGRCPAQDAEDVELLPGDPLHFDDPLEHPPQLVGCADNRDQPLLRRRPERALLLQLTLQGVGHDQQS